MKKFYFFLFPAILFIVILASFSTAYAADITTTSQGGLWDDKTTWIGGALPTATDNVFITSTIYTGNSYYSTTTFKMRNLTVNAGGKIIRELEKVGMYSLDISGNLINNGEIIDYKDYFDLKVGGNIINNGILKPRNLSMAGQGQKISGTKPIESKTFNLNMTDDELTAASNLSFRNCNISSNSSFTTKKLNMKTFSLSLAANEITYDSYYGQVTSPCEVRQPLIFEGAGKITVDKAKIGNTVVGNITIDSPTYAFIADMVVEGSLTVTEGSKISSYANRQNLKIRGNFTNYGEINKDTVRVSNLKFPPRSMNLYVSGNVTNHGSTGITTVYPVTNGKTITMSGNYDGNVYIKQSEGTDKPGGKVLINSQVDILGKLDVYANLEIGSSGFLNLLYKIYIPITVSATDGSLTNKGRMYQYHSVNSSWGYRSFSKLPGMNIDFELRDWTLPIEGVDVTVHNGSTYPNLPGSTLRWWRVKPVVTGLVKYYTLKLYYDETQLNGQQEKNLKVYRSTDEGKNWEVVSVGTYAKLDTIENSISIGSWTNNASMLTEFGDFVISSGDGSVPMESSILVDMIGRSNVRVGAPNPFTIHVYNITNYRTSPVMLTMAVSEDIRFKEVRFPYDGGVEILPIDSISDKDDLTQVFFIPYLEPNEHYSFDVIVYGLPNKLKSTAENLVTLTLGGFFGHVAEDEAIDFAVEKVGEAVDLNESEKTEYARGLGLTVNQLKTEKQQYGKTVTTIRHISKYTVKNIADTNPITKVLFKVGEGAEAVYKIKDSLRRRLFHWLYKEVGLYGVEENVASGKQVNGTLVKSWDPNEIIGPRGYGEEHFIASIPTMNYTIMFENKKEATAAAYRIQIVDTLSAAFNPETVKFLELSHSGTQYNWKMERNGNILKWDIEGIELPANVTPPEGEGFVSFSVDLKKDLASGTKIANRATIIFDMNPPITTNVWKNVLDIIAPKTIMNPIKYVNGDSIINISCSSTDDVNGSGTQKYNYYVSVNNKPFGLIDESFENTIQYPVSATEKNSYRFYAIATDNVNNSEIKVPEIIEIKSIPVSSKFVEQSADQLKIYPNPTSGFISVDFLTVSQTTFEIQLYSIEGKLLKDIRTGSVEAGQRRIDFDISDLSQGVYFTKVSYGNITQTFKVIKN